MKQYKIESIEQSDIELTEKLNKTTKKQKQDILYLYKKYIDSTTYICTSCNSEYYALWKQYYFYYKKYIENQNG